MVSMRWNGKTWQRVPVLQVNSGQMDAAAFIQGGTVWAVGTGDIATYNNPALIMRWTGRAWTQVKIPADENANQLVAVSASSTRNAWAVGWEWASGSYRT
jgi:hypothetical protein